MTNNNPKCENKLIVGGCNCQVAYLSSEEWNCPTHGLTSKKKIDQNIKEMAREFAEALKPKPLPSECPVCLTVQTGAHTCKRAKPLPSEPKCEHYSAHFKTSYRWKKDGMFAWGDVCPFCPVTKGESCVHDGTDRWCDYKNNPTSPFVALKEDCPECPICKPVEIRKDCQEGKVYGFNPDYMKTKVEPSVEAFDAGLIQEIYDYCDYRRKVSGVARDIIELIKRRKNERNSQ